MSEKKHKRAKPENKCGYGILTPWGNFWSTDIYESEAAAKTVFDRYWRDIPNAPPWEAYRVVPARISISEITPTQEDDQ